MKRTVEKIIAYAVEVAEPDKVILFGSVSRGTADVYSDLDVLIIAGEEADKKHISARVTRFAWELALKADVLVFSESEIAAGCEKPNSFLASVLKDGKIVYQK